MGSRIACVFACFLLSSCATDFTFEKTTELQYYPSGSGIESISNKIYLIGDDVNYLLVADKEFNRIDTIRLFGSDTARISKDLKPDMESLTVMSADEHPSLMMVASGSSDKRNKGWILDPETTGKQEINLDTFYNRIRLRGIDQLNIEGLAAFPGGFILANRGNKSFPKNHLILTSKDFWLNQSVSPIKIIPIGTQSDTSVFNGVSGMDYSYISDRLVMTISTENTYSNITDGDIGKSYLWIINDFSTKRRAAAINPNRIIDLTEMDPHFKSQKIESICILSESKKKLELALAADNDRGKTELFRISVR